MGGEGRKSYARRLRWGDYDKYFSGRGIDIGAGNAPLFDNPAICLPWDKKEGDATLMEQVPDESFDWVFSSHCLEHIQDHRMALKNWWRILRPGGYLIVVVPDFALYEHRVWPSTYNRDHKHWFTMYSLIDLVAGVIPTGQVIRVQLNDEGFDYADHTKDQTSGEAQAEIEIIVRKIKDLFWVGGE